uniref:Uncharacterized protein n=1 Tax=Anopheles arabiensis TaxID=7173 RepID=A0A182I5V9_ANOAR
MKEKNDNLKAKSTLFWLQELVESFESTFHSDAVHSPEIAVPMQQFSDPVHRMYLSRKTPIPKPPPTSIQIQGYSQHAKVEVREGEELTLTCVVPNARPAAQIVWYRANVEYKSNTIETKSAETEDHRYTATSKLQLQPTAEDDYIDYTCQARHQAIPEDRPMQSTVQLSVL